VSVPSPRASLLSLCALPAGVPRALRYDATDGAAVDLALVAVAACDAWASGTSGVPRPPLAAQILAACKRVGRTHHIFVSEHAHVRARTAMATIATRVNAVEPAMLRPAVLCALLLDLLNDRHEPAFARVSDTLSRLSLPGGEHHGARIADDLRADFGLPLRGAP